MFVPQRKRTKSAINHFMLPVKNSKYKIHIQINTSKSKIQSSTCSNNCNGYIHSTHHVNIV